MFSLLYALRNVIYILVALWLGIMLFFLRKKIKEFYLYRFRRNDYLRCFIMNENRQIIMHPATITANHTIRFGKEQFNVSENAVYFMKKRPCMFFMRNCIDPIKFEITNKKDVTTVVDSSSFNDIMENKIIRDLVKEAKMMFFIIIMLIAVIMILLAVGMHEYGFVTWTAGKAAAAAGM